MPSHANERPPAEEPPEPTDARRPERAIVPYVHGAVDGADRGAVASSGGIDATVSAALDRRPAPTDGGRG